MDDSFLELYQQQSLSSPEEMDQVEALFANMPSPKEEQTTLRTADRMVRYRLAFEKFVSDLKTPSASNDDDHAELGEHVKRGLELGSVDHILSQIAKMALLREPEHDDQSAKAKYFRYLRWAARGRKYDDSPLTTAQEKQDPSKPEFNMKAEGPHGKYAILPGPAVILGCAHCGKLRSKASMVGCEDCTLITGGYDICTVAGYCGAKCQKKHRKEHGKICKQIRGLNRAAQVFQQVFVHFLQTVHDPTRNIAEVSLGLSEAGSMVAVKMEPNTLLNLACLGKPVVEAAKTPKMIVANPELRKAALMVGNSSAVATSAKSLLEYFVRPACKSMERVAILPKNMFRPAELIDDSGASHFNALTPHEVIRLTLECGRQYALDPAGCAFGWEEHLASWESFAAHRVALVVEVCTLPPSAPWNRVDLSAMAKQRDCAGTVVGEPRAEVALARRVVADLAVPAIEMYMTMGPFQAGGVVGGWEEFLGTDVTHAWFAGQAQGLVAAVERLLRDKAEAFERETGLRFFLNRELDVRVVIGPELARGLARVWMGWEEVEGLRGDVNRLKQAWRSRWDVVFGMRGGI
ncbi:hypothetical protein B0T25DRAFT_609569 [Lasiosphaeria hispida]|uniref:MYND-type domain-containing protein n=1 Tax=Lasiosphaeria hispida TaxID=260671 RepID=A0AAJ0MBZ8_9PEZI|nr:hypothetical protein B0T25DRAFT_609569 [Lasiosphaeria hispida]